MRWSRNGFLIAFPWWLKTLNIFPTYLLAICTSFKDCLFNSLATCRMKQDPGLVWLFSIPSIHFFLKSCFSGVSGLLQDCEELGSLTNSTKTPILVAQFKHKKSVFGLDAISSGILRFTEEVASQVPKMLANEQHDAVLGCRKQQREREWNSRTLCSVGEHTFFVVLQGWRACFSKQQWGVRPTTNLWSLRCTNYREQKASHEHTRALWVPGATGFHLGLDIALIRPQ